MEYNLLDSIMHQRQHSQMRMMLVLVLVVMQAALCLGQIAPPAEVTIDFRQREAGIKSMSGFLHSLSGGKPPDSMIVPLHPALWRDGPSLERFARVNRLGARLIVVVSDIWRGEQPKKMPYDDYAAWDTLITKHARILRGKNVIWDIWNEPETKHYWSGTPSQFLETFHRAHDILRRELGDSAVISGPSIVVWDSPVLGIRQFMEYCRSNGLRVDVLSWHELGEEKDIPKIADHLKYARKEFIDNPAYSSVHVKEIQINEIVGQSSHYKPSAILAWFTYLEEGRADGACKACWMDDDGNASCGNYTLDGILTPKTFRPRAAWWVYKLYSDGIKSRVLSTSSEPSVVCLSSQTSSDSGQAQILLGLFDTGQHEDTMASVNLSLRNVEKLPFVKGQGRVEVTFFRVPDSGPLPLPHPILERKETLSMSTNGIKVQLPHISMHEVYLLLLRWTTTG